MPARALVSPTMPPRGRNLPRPLAVPRDQKVGQRREISAFRQTQPCCVRAFCNMVSLLPFTSGGGKKEGGLRSRKRGGGSEGGGGGITSRLATLGGGGGGGGKGSLAPGTSIPNTILPTVQVCLPSVHNGPGFSACPCAFGYPCTGLGRRSKRRRAGFKSIEDFKRVFGG